ncbi:MAG TPA: 50S ribosomal protein L24 [Oligoflexia bacterium]|nr:50S ribosomal protein L24 [Oligoflexia bacterium]HMR25761.1 50S ribosomal protein L24 [Oligoflexia bacterium]
MSRVNRANKKIKVGDTVRVIAGKDSAGKGKVGKVLSINAKTDRAIVEKVNMVKKHKKGDDRGNQGGIFDQESSIHLSNLSLVSGAKEEKAPKKTTTKKKTAKKVSKKAENKN